LPNIPTLIDRGREAAEAMIPQILLELMED
jgi:hypothetical protein